MRGGVAGWWEAAPASALEHQRCSGSRCARPDICLKPKYSIPTGGPMLGGQVRIAPHRGGCYVELQMPQDANT